MAKTKTKTPTDIREMIDRQVECRTFGHAWSPKQVTNGQGTISIHLQCSRCETARVDRVSKSTGDLNGRAYDYADGYLGHGRVRRNIFRFEFVTRSMKR